MHSSYEYLESLRNTALSHLPSGSFLKLDRGDALMICNVSPSTKIPGFTLIPRGSITALYPDADTVLEFEKAFDPAGELSRSVRRFRGNAINPEAIVLFSEGLKLAQLSAPSRIENYEKLVRQFIALSLRNGQTGGTYAAALLADMLNKTAEVSS